MSETPRNADRYGVAISESHSNEVSVVVCHGNTICPLQYDLRNPSLPTHVRPRDCELTRLAILNNTRPNLLSILSDVGFEPELLPLGLRLLPAPLNQFRSFVITRLPDRRKDSWGIDALVGPRSFRVVQVGSRGTSSNGVTRGHHLEGPQDTRTDYEER